MASTTLIEQALQEHLAGNLQKAEKMYRKVLECEPDNADAIHFLGVLAHQMGNHDLAVALIKKALSIKPKYLEAYVNLGIVLSKLGRFDEAISAYQNILSINPDSEDALFNLANIYQQTGNIGEAIRGYERLLSKNPHHIKSLYNKGIILNEMGNYEEAILCYQKVADIQPNYIDAINNLGNIYLRQSQHDKAIICYEKILSLQPEHLDANNNLGSALKEQGLLSKAIECFNKVLALEPHHADAYYNLGTVLKEQGKIDNAIANFKKALENKPNNSDAANNLANSLLYQGHLDEAIDWYKQAISIEPGHFKANSNLLMSLNYHPEIDARDIAKEHLDWGQRIEQVVSGICTKDYSVEKTSRRIRVGYVSADLRTHSVSYFFEPILFSHNQEEFEVYCYYNHNKEDDCTKRLKNKAEYWRSIFALDDQEVRNLIINDKIDILVDLAGHTNGNRLHVFATKPAPIQVTWLGYPNTTGLKKMDYRLTDTIVDPEGESEPLHSEKLYRLSTGFLCYVGNPGIKMSTTLPSLKNGYITFGSFNNLTKITSKVIKLWVSILKQISDSRLILKAIQFSDIQIKENYYTLFENNGIARERVQLYSFLPDIESHLQLYEQIDLALDPFPYNGTTTTCEALWMGVPTITLKGERNVSRVGASIMKHAGLEQFIASDEGAYLQIALSHSRDTGELASLREQFREKLSQSEICDRKNFVLELEQAYRNMWYTYSDKL